MPNQPLNLNLARIVHRLMTSPRGWRVSHLTDELGIAARTYRKYRRLLQEDFFPFLRRDGTSVVVEVMDGDERYLRLRPPRELSVVDPTLEHLTAAVYFAHSLLTQTGHAELQLAADALVADLHAAVRDRDFLFRGALAHADRMFVTDSRALAGSTQLGPLLRAIANQREVEIRVGATTSRVAPLTLLLRRDSMTLIVMNRHDEFEEFELDDLEIEVLNTTFEYPAASRYSPFFNDD